ncbi:MAG TPA: FHA domain-containing protein, partial [Leifsonia sp.]
MKLKLSVVVPGAPDRDVSLVADVTATVGDLARRLAIGAGADATRALTLRVEHPGSRQGQVLDAATAVVDSSLRSGCRAEIVPVGERRPGDELDSTAAAVVRVIEGPDAGRTFRIPRGTSLIGRDTAAAVCFHEDHEVSRRHATLTVDRVITVTDLNSANGVQVDGALVHRAEVGRERVRVGTTVFQVEVVAEGSSTRAPDDFVRSPRVEPSYDGVAASLPEVPAPAEPPRLPALALVSPLLIGVVLLAVSRQPTALLFVAASPLIMLGTWLDGRFRARRSLKRARLRFEERLDALRTQLRGEREREREAREAESPSSADVARAVHSRSALLWTRTPEHPAFLELRFGLGRLPSRSPLGSPAAGADDAGEEERASVRALEEEFAEVGGVPVLETFRRAGAIGVAGRGMLADDAARALVLQLAGLHSPADLVIVAFTGPDAGEAWSWLSWLPHVDSPH